MSGMMSTSLEPLDDLSRGRGRGLLALFGAVGVIAVLLVVWLLVPGDGPQPLPPTTTTAAEDDEDPDAPDLGPDDDDAVAEDVPVVTYEIYLARDPFEPVVPEDLPQPDVADPDDPVDPTDPDPTDPDPTDPDPTDPDPTDPDPVDPTDPRDPDEPDRCEGDVEVVCNGEVVSLMDITEDDTGRLAVIQVDTTVYEVRSGEVFADRYRLLEIGTDRVRVLFGDEDFSLRKDETVLK